MVLVFFSVASLVVLVVVTLSVLLPRLNIFENQLCLGGLIWLAIWASAAMRALSSAMLSLADQLLPTATYLPSIFGGFLNQLGALVTYSCATSVVVSSIRMASATNLFMASAGLWVCI